MKVYVLGIPHTQTRLEYSTCAFTIKAYHLCKMLYDRGHEVIHLGVEGSNPPCTENVALVKEDFWRKGYSHPGTKFYDLDCGSGVKKDIQDEFARNARREFDRRRGADWTEIVCCPWGTGHAEAVRQVRAHQFTVESGIGYPYTFLDNRVFESYAWMHFHHGKENRGDGHRWYDVVIPNSFDVSHFTFQDRGKRGEHLVYLGRLIDSKGVGVACHIAKEAGRDLIICGQGDPEPFLRSSPQVKYLPPVTQKGRDNLLGQAAGVIMPTFYIEPFGGVAIEAQMTGCPVISTDWGAFPETVLHGITGYRCRTFEQFVWAAKHVSELDCVSCRVWAATNYSLERVAEMYEEYFEALLDLRTRGWYEPRPGRTELGWLTKRWPRLGAKDIPRKTIYPKKCNTADADVWKKAQAWEQKWWGEDPAAPHWQAEREKQDMYSAEMQLDNKELTGKTVLDMGGGPISILLRRPHGPSVVIDPLPLPKALLNNYREQQIDYWPVPGEDVLAGTNVCGDRARFDEGWMYNCLQHTRDPRRVLDNLLSRVQTVRIFEWLHTPVNDGHPHSLTEKLFKDALAGWIVQRWCTGIKCDTDYIAIVAHRPAEKQ